MQKKTKILAAIPCYNEEATVGSVVLKAKQHVDEVLVIDDGSTDDTAQIAEAAGATVMIHGHNKGKAAGVKEAFRYAIEHEYYIVVTVDGDGQHDSDEIPQLLAPLLDDKADIAIGFRSGQRTEMPFWRKIGKRTLDYATGVGTRQVTDSQCGFRAFTKMAIEKMASQLRGNGFSVESEQLVLAKDNNLRIAEVKSSCRYRNLKSSKKNPLTHGPSVLAYIIWLVAEQRPLIFIGIPGLALIITGIFFGIRTIQYYNQTDVFLISYALITTLLLIIGSLAVLMSFLMNILPHIIQRSRE